jgi:hypothetical protein
MKFDKFVQSIISKEPVKILDNQEAVKQLVKILGQTQPGEVADVVIEALSRYYTLDPEQTQALASFFDQHLSD